MNKEFFEKRLSNLKQSFDAQKSGIEQAQANLNAFSGAIQECQFHLSQIIDLEKDVLQSEKKIKKEKSKPEKLVKTQKEKK